MCVLVCLGMGGGSLSLIMGRAQLNHIKVKNTTKKKSLHFSASCFFPSAKGVLEVAKYREKKNISLVIGKSYVNTIQSENRWVWL